MGLHFRLPAKGTGREALIILTGLPSWISGPGQLPSLLERGALEVKYKGTATHPLLMTSEIDFGPEGKP